MIILKNFQENAVTDVYEQSVKFLEGHRKATIVLKSPTGSGKTLMMSQIIERLTHLESENLCFLWVSIGKGELHKQSQKSLVRYFNGNPKCCLLEQEFTGSREIIDQNEVVVFNWQKINQKDKDTGEWANVLMKTGEMNSFPDVIENTKADGRKIVLIVDESHTSATTERAKELRDKIINADLTLEMSATPSLDDKTYIYEVPAQEVINEGLIKKEVIINQGIDKIIDDEATSETAVLESAVQKRDELAQLYKENGSNVNPLVLIQIPNSENGDAKRDSIVNFLGRKGITTDNGKLAVWFSGTDKENIDPTLALASGDVEYLIFKQAIDTGWDCPRAQILVRFREVHSANFNIQTIGRILRMPEAKHYDNDILNTGYIYTNLQTIIVDKETYNPNIIKSLYSYRSDKYTPLQLRSYYKHRTSYNDIVYRDYYNVFDDVFCNVFKINKNNINLSINIDKIRDNGWDINNKASAGKIIKDKAISGIEVDSPTEIIGDYDMNLSSGDRNAVITQIFKSELGGFIPSRSLSPMKNVFYAVFDKYLDLRNGMSNGIEWLENFIFNNQDKVKQLLHSAIERYKPLKLSIDKEIAESAENWMQNWEISESNAYNQNEYEIADCEKNIYQPCYLRKDRSNPEKEFIKNYLNSNKDILWWWKNGDEHKETNFGIEQDVSSDAFRPDFIVAYTNGTIGFYDTKSDNYMVEDTRKKAEALQKYIEEENAKGKKLTGGIVVVDGGHLRLNNKKSYKTLKDAPDDWEYIN